MRYAVCSATVVIRLTLSITAARGESWRLIDALRSLMVPTRRERGFVSCQLLLSSESCDPMRISYVESDRFSRLLELMESALEPPQLEFALGNGTRGLDYVEEVRADRSRRRRVDPGAGTRND